MVNCLPEAWIVIKFPEHIAICREPEIGMSCGPRNPTVLRGSIEKFAGAIITISKEGRPMDEVIGEAIVRLTKRK